MTDLALEYYFGILHVSMGYNCESHYNFWFVNGLVNVFSLVHLITALFTILIIRHVIGYINYTKRLEFVMSRKISEVAAMNTELV